MASQEEDNKLECISNVNKEQERYYFNVYKKYDSILNDKSENFETKVSSLIEVWSSIAELNLSQFDIRYVIQIIDWAKLHALNIVLTGEWRSTKESFRDSLLESIEKAQTCLANVNEAFASRCQKLADVVRKPWEDPVLANLIQEKDVEIGSKEIEFFCVETAYLVSVRLKKLCENHCEDLALNLVTNFLNYKKLATVQNFNLNATETQLWFIFDIYIALLYKFQDKSKILQQFEELQLGEGVQLIKRFAKKRVKISKIWRNCHKIAIFGSRFFMSRALMKYTEDYKEFLTDLLKTYLALSNTETLLQEFVLSVRNITNLADAAGLCVMCEVVHRESSDKLRVFVIEMYIRALTTDMNELERLKHVNEEDKVKLTTSRLAHTFTNLADLLDDHVKVARECVLTAFSLEPTKDRLKRIEELAKRSGFPVLDTGQEWKCRLHPPVLPSDDLAWVCPECGEWMCKPELTAPLQMNMALHEALQESVLGISEALCDDLVVCLSNPRYQILSWLLAWSDLYRLCILYLNDPEKTKNFVTELKFVDVDYSMFEHIKREPVDEFTGIEKGYEQYLDLDFVSDEETSSVSEDSMSHDRSVGLGSDGAGEPYLQLPQPKSDPTTLKSLRMFRPNLKRKKEDSDAGSSDKKPASPTGGTSPGSSATSTLENYLSSSPYDIPAINGACSTSTYSNKTSINSVYLPQAAEVAKQHTKPILSKIAAASNFSPFGYLSAYAAKQFEMSNQPVSHSRSNFNPANLVTAYNSSINPGNYTSSPETKKTLSVSLPASSNSQPATSVFNTANLCSAASASYVSNIIKSTLSYGVPKVSLTGSSEMTTNSNSFGALTVSKQGLFPNQNQATFNAPKQSAFASSSPASQKSTSDQNYATHNNSSRQDSLDSSILTSQKNNSQQIITNTVPDLEALLNEFENNKFETESKNGVAATLLQLGGQVAKNQKQLIQVQPNQIQTKLPQETCSSSGTNDEHCKTSLENLSNPDPPNHLGLVPDQPMEPVCKRPKLTQESNKTDKTSSPGKTTLNLTELRVKIPKLNLEKYIKEDKSPTGKALGQREPPSQIQRSLPTIRDSNKTKPPNCRVSVAKLPLENTIQLPPEIRQFPRAKLSVQLTPLKLPFSKPAPSTFQQDKSQSQREKYPILPCQKEQSSMLPELPLLKATALPAVPLAALEPQHKTAVNEELHQAPRRLESVIIIPPVKASQIISQALLKHHQDNSPLLKDPVLEQLNASISLVKNKESLETTNTPNSPLKVGTSHSPLKVVASQKTNNNPISQIKSPTICTPADSPKTITPIIMNCDKDKKVQKDNQKTDVEMTEITEKVTSSPEDNKDSVSGVSLKKTDERVSPISFNDFTDKEQASNEYNIIESSEDLEASSTQNINNSIIVDRDMASDTIRLENNSDTRELENNTEETQYRSNNKNDIMNRERNDIQTFIENHHVVNYEVVETVNIKLNCDNKEENTEIINKESDEQTVTEDEKKVQESTDENTKDVEVISGQNECIDEQIENIVIDNSEDKPKTTELKDQVDDVSTFKTINPDFCNSKTLASYLETEMEIPNTENNKVVGGSSNRKDYISPIKALQDDTVYTLDYEIGKNIMVEGLEDTQDLSGSNTIAMDVLSTVNEIKENILQSIEDQEVIKTKSLEKRYSKCTYREEVRVKIGPKNPFKYIKYWHNYCRCPKVPKRTSKPLTQSETVDNAVDSSIPVENKSTSTQINRPTLFEIIEADISKLQDKYLLFTDDHNESLADLNKENIKYASDDSMTDATILSIEEIDNEDLNSNNNIGITSPSQHFNFDFSYFNDDKGEKNMNNHVKKYSNKHKRKHENVPCFKMDQEKDTCGDDMTGFKPKELSVMLKRLPHRVTKRVQNLSLQDSITILQQRLREKIRVNADAPICVVYKKEKQSSPLLDSNIRNQVKKNRFKKQKPDFRNAMKKAGISKKKMNFPKGNILKKKSDFPSKKPKKEKDVEFLSGIDDSSDAAKSMLKNVPGLNDFSEVRPCNTEHVVNVVQVSGSRPSTVTNQNTQTSTQVTPHIQRIGQPKLPEQKSERLEEKSEQSPSSSRTTNVDSVKPSTSQSSTLINILSSQLKPGQKTSATSRQPPFINILSQQILKQPNNKPNSNRPTATANHNKNDKSNPDDGYEKTATVIKVEPEENVEVQASNSINTNLKIVTSTTQAGGAVTTAPSSTQPGTILQFICKSSSLPKFQQAFGKTVYQTSASNEGTTEVAAATAASTTETTNQTPTATVLETKKIATKAIPVNVQPITGNVIFRGQVPVGQTVSLIPPGSNTRQLFRITGSTHEQISLVKETVIQNKMSALLAAALQGKPKITEQNGELVEEYSATRITLCRPGTVPPNATRIVKPVQLQIPANVIRAPQPNLSSTTLEQLREFDMVYKQVKERSSNPAQPETTVQSSQESPQQQRISFTYVNQVQKYTQLSPVVVVSSYSPIQQTVSPALSVTSQSGTGTCLTQVSTVAVPKVAVKTSKGKNIKSTATKTSPTAVPTIPKPQQKPQEDEHTTQRIFDILAEYAEQLRNSPDLNNKPAPRRRSNPPTNPSSSTSGSGSSKKKKKKSSSSTTSNLVETDNEDLTMGSEDSSGGNIVQLSMTDEEQSQSASITPPETNLEPATSSTPTPRPLIVTDTSNQPRNVIIADSSVGEALKMPNTALLMPGSYIMPVSVVKGGQQIAVVSGGSKILTTVPARSGQNMLLFQSFVNQNKKGGISTVKYSTLQPFAGISSQNVAGLSAQPPVVLPSNSVATVALGQPITLKKLDDNERGSNTELLLTISQPRETIKVEQSSDIPQPDSSTSLSSDAIDVKIEEGSQSDTSSNEVFTNIQKTNSVATSVIASVVKKEQEEISEKSAPIDTSTVKEESTKQAERIGSVLVNASTSNGPMLSHTNPRYRKPSENVESTTAPVKEFNHNAGKAPPSATKIFKNNAVYYAIRTKKPVNKKIDSEMQKQAAMERELRLQKSLSEECEDLGVDEPSTSDLFPEADLLFDSNHSPSYDQSGQRIQVAEVKAKDSMNLFSDDENSGPMRNDLFDYVEYHHPSEATVDQMNGNNASNESASSCDDTTLLPNCGTMSEVTLNSPISPDYTDSSHAVNKYKYKYTNRKKGEKVIRPQTEWSEVTSTEDSMEIAKEEDTPIAIKEETVIDDSLTTEMETIIEERTSDERDIPLKCPLHGSGDNKSSRRNSRKPCSCFNGSKSPTPSNAKRRVSSPKSQPSTPSKKPLLSKKR